MEKIQGLLGRYMGTIIGGSPGENEYIVNIPDPGTSFAAIESIVTQLNSEAGVTLARKIYYRTPMFIDGRYPNDGPGSQGSDWLVPTNATRPLLQIRAPLAWGCETGSYTASRVAVGVIDYMFDDLNPDLTGTEVLPPLPNTNPDHRLQTDFIIRGHGTAVTGILAAQADNGVGIAGMLWQSNLTMLSYSNNQRVEHDLAITLSIQINEAIARGLRVLTIASGFAAISADSFSITRQQRALKRYLDSGGLIVIATGEQNLRQTIAQLAQSQDDAVGATKVAVARLYQNGYANKIIWVAGTDNTGAFWQTSNSWTGATVVAPATNILTLANTADPPNATTQTWQGTSFAAPYVAGVAGLLLAMDPTLTASQIKDYILRGELEPRLDPQTGQLAPQPPVLNAPETLYQLDAYGSLTLLARERSGISLCGNRVWVNNNAVVRERDPVAHTTETLVNLGEQAGYVNVRQGGRRIEVSTPTQTRAFALQQGSWVATTDAATSQYGGTFLSTLAYSHGVDSTASFRQMPAANSAPFEVNIFDFYSQVEKSIDTVVAPLIHFTDGVCIRLVAGVCDAGAGIGVDQRVSAAIAFPPIGGRILLSVTYFDTRDVGLGPWQACPTPPCGGASDCRTISYQERTDSASLWSVGIQSGSDTLLWSFPDRVYWFGVSEDGAQVVSGEGMGNTAWTLQPKVDGSGFENVWSDPGSVSGCAVHYRNIVTGADLIPAIATTDACTSTGAAGGTITPIRKSP